MTRAEAAEEFLSRLQAEAATFEKLISTNDGDWIVKGFIDIFKNVYTISADTKVVSKLIELMLFPSFLRFAEKYGCKVVLSREQNHYPDLTFVTAEGDKFAVDLKSTYRLNETSVNSMTLGAFTGYFRNRTSLPLQLAHTGVPPIKCQGIKTKLVPFIFGSLQWAAAEEGRWVEPFLGSGVVALNLAPARALLADTNRHIINFYRAIQSGDLNCEIVREFLFREGKLLEAGGVDYYYEVRRRFNQGASALDFLFLNRSCFNGVMRFNRSGGFNVPFGHKPQRFAQAYITKISNQVNWVAKQMRGKDWEFRVARWEETLAEAQPDDFVYLDPPYIGRHTDYYNGWSEDDAVRLSEVARDLPCGFALSMWLENKYRKNTHLEQSWSQCETRVCRHFYHVGSSEELRNAIDEALMIKHGFASAEAPALHQESIGFVQQLSLAIEKRAAYQV